MVNDASKLETKFLFVPAIEFLEASQGWDYLAKQPLLQMRLSGEGSVVTAGGRLFIPFFDRPRPESTSAILLDESLTERWRHISIQLFGTQAKLPEGAKFCCLLVEGRYTFERNLQINGARPTLWYRTINGPRDAYAVWMDPNGVPLSAAFHVSRTPPKNKILRSVYSMNHAALGAIYAREAAIDDRGAISGSRETLVVIKFNIRTIECAPETTLYVHAIRKNVLSPSRKRSWVRLTRGLDDAEVRVASLARDRFDHACTEIPLDFEERREFFERQIRGLEADRRRRERDQFERRMAVIPWAEALDHVTEAWQLAVVADLHADEEFDVEYRNTRERIVRDPSHVRLYRMITRYQCDDQRRERLFKLARDYGLIPS